MSDKEFEILDELYFVTTFDQLMGLVNLDEIIVKNILRSLYSKGWIRILSSPEEEIMGEVDVSSNYQDYMYLASKKGLLEHNSN